jgi:hypothetical protein
MNRNTNQKPGKNLKLIIILFYLITCYHSVWAQFSVKILNEDFSSNAMRWDTRKDSSSEMEIKDGKYLLKNKLDGSALSTTIDMPHLQTENFRIIATISKNKGIDNNGFGLVWGAKDMNNDFEFVISSNGYFKILKWENGQKEDIIDWTYQSAINKWDFSRNELKIECTSKIIRFYINGTYVSAAKYIKPLGQRIGFILNETMEIEADEIIAENFIKNFNEDAKTGLPNIQIAKVELIGNETFNILKVGEKANLNIELSNTGTDTAKDLILSILTKDSTNGLIYNQLSMIDEIKPGETKQVKIPIEAGENTLEQNVTLNLNLKTVDKTIIDTDSYYFETKVPVSSYKPDTNIPNDNPYNYKPGHQKDDYDNCTNGCLSTGIATVVTAILMAIFE